MKVFAALALLGMTKAQLTACESNEDCPAEENGCCQTMEVMSISEESNFGAFNDLWPNGI